MASDLAEPRFKIPDEVLMRIFLNVSPVDLLRLQATCKAFRELLDHQQQIWRMARRRMVPPVPDPILPNDLHGFAQRWSEPAYAALIFGCTLCSFCGREILSLVALCSFATRQMHCGRKQFATDFASDQVRFTFLPTQSKEAQKDIKSYLPIVETTLRKQGGGWDPRHYSRVRLHKALEEWDEAHQLWDAEKYTEEKEGSDGTFAFDRIAFNRHIRIRQSWLDSITETAESLTEWRAAFEVACEEYQKLNLSF